MSGRQNWTYEEHLLAFNVYCKIPFGTIHMGNPKLIELADLLGRSVGAVSYKLPNFARLDPVLKQRGIRGLTHGSHGEQEIWEEFGRQPEKLAFESERLLSEKMNRSLIEFTDIKIDDVPEGKDRESIVRVRVNQNFFRQRILSAYNYTCCVTGLKIPELLVASHIVPWARDAINRLNPRNGLCLNALHDRAFDRGLMRIEDNYKIRFAKKLHEKAKNDQSLSWIVSFEGRGLNMPERFSPDPELLRIHTSTAIV